MSIWDCNVVYLLLLDRKHNRMKITYGPLPDVLVISLSQGQGAFGPGSVMNLWFVM